MVNRDEVPVREVVSVRTLETSSRVVWGGVEKKLGLTIGLTRLASIPKYKTDHKVVLSRIQSIHWSRKDTSSVESLSERKCLLVSDSSIHSVTLHIDRDL